MKDLKPLIISKKPLYPDKAAVQRDPALLAKLPERWVNSKKAALTAGLLAAMAVSFTACAPGQSVPGGVPLPPKMVTENDAVTMIKNMADGFFASAIPYAAKDIKQTVSYVQYDANQKSFLPVTPAEDKKSIRIDAYDSLRNIGIEYLSDEKKTTDETAEFSPAGSKLEADKKNAYILVMNEAYDQGEKENAAIKEQVEAFITWLKAEGII